MLHNVRLRSSILTNLGIGGGLVVLASACSPAPMPISQSSRDPSNPSAAEGVTPAVAASLASGASSSPDNEGRGHEHHTHTKAEPEGLTMDHQAHATGVAASADAGAQAVVYVCPMHPEVTSSTAGSVCPKCKMKLVPKK